MSKKNTVRFAVGNPHGPRSTVWRVWTSGGHVFISPRLYGDTIKASLHKSGKWRWGLTGPYAEREDSRLPPGADRAFHKWERPLEMFPGVVSAFDIIVPSTELSVPRRQLPEEVAEKYLSKVYWVSPPSSEAELHFRVLFIAPDSPIVVTNDVVWQRELPSGEAVVLIVYEQALTQDGKRQLASAKREIFQQRGKADEDSTLRAAREPRAFLQGYAEDGTRFLVDISTDFLFE